MFGRLFTYTAALLLLAGSPALAQQGDGKPVSPNPFVQVNIDEQNGCKGEVRHPSAEELCGDFSHPQFPAFKNPGETAVQEARLQCVNYYRLGLRLQSIFCSYSTDSALFYANSRVAAQQASVGEQNVSQHAVAADNRTIAGINQKYMERIRAVALEFQGAYGDYLKAIGHLNGQASRDFLREASCHMQSIPSNLDIRSPVPGFVRETLANHSQANAVVTFRYVMEYTRNNYRNLRDVKEKAEENTQRAEMNELGIPSRLENTMGQGSSGTGDGAKANSPTDAAMYAVYQDLITRGIKAKFPSLPGPAGSLIGGGIVVVWQYKDNKRIMYPETIATFIGMLNPYVGMAANITVAAYRTSEQNQDKYRDFCKAAIKSNIRLTSPELVALWGKEQKGEPKKQEICEASAKMAAACVQKRLQGFQAYSGDNCALPALDMRDERERVQRIQALQRKLGIQ